MLITSTSLKICRNVLFKILKLFLQLLVITQIAVLVIKMAEYKGAASEGNRAMHMQKRRERAKEQIAEMKAKIVNVSGLICASALQQKA